MISEVTYNIITLNRPEILAKALFKLCEQGGGWTCLIFDSAEYSSEGDERVASSLRALKAVGVRVQYIHEPGRVGIPMSYQRSAELADTRYVIRQEDDMLPEVGFIERLVKVMKRFEGDRVLGVGFACPHYNNVTPRDMSIYMPNAVRPWTTDGKDVLEPYDGQQQWYRHPEIDRIIFSVPHVHAGFLYNRKQFLDLGGFWTECNCVGHREETYITMKHYFNGWSWLFCPAAVSVHYEFPSGGSRDDLPSRRQMQIENEERFQTDLRKWMADHPERPIHVGGSNTYKEWADRQAVKLVWRIE